MKNDLEKRTGIPAPVVSRRKFIGAAAATGVAGIFSPRLAPISAQGPATKAAQFVLPNATKDVTAFKLHVPQAALDDLKKKHLSPGRRDKSVSRSCYIQQLISGIVADDQRAKAVWARKIAADDELLPAIKLGQYGKLLNPNRGEVAEWLNAAVC